VLVLSLFLFAVTRFRERATMALLWILNGDRTDLLWCNQFFMSMFSCLKERDGQKLRINCALQPNWVLLIQHLTHFLFLQLACALVWHNWAMNRTAPLPHSDPPSGRASVPVRPAVVFEQRSVGRHRHENYKYSNH